jgi:hypothetical protein
MSSPPEGVSGHFQRSQFRDCHITSLPLIRHSGPLLKLWRTISSLVMDIMVAIDNKALLASSRYLPQPKFDLIHKATQSTAALTGRQIISQPKMHMPIPTRTQLSMDGSYRPPRSTIAIPRHQVLFRVHILFITLESCQQLVSASNIVDYWPVQVNEC